MVFTNLQRPFLPGPALTRAREGVCTGFQALDRRKAHLLFKVIAYCNERGATIFTCNKGVRDWLEMLAGAEVLATAILNRLLHHCHVLQVDGRSFRLRQM